MKSVYFARIVGTDGPIKIGCSAYPKGRCRQLGSDLAAEVEVIAETPGDYVLERNLHLKFADQRAEGPKRDGKVVAGQKEWFHPTAELLGLIQSAKSGAISLPLQDCRERMIAAHYGAGKTLQQIGSRYGISRERVRQILHSLGVPRRSAFERGALIRAQRRARIEAWLAEVATRKSAV